MTKCPRDRIAELYPQVNEEETHLPRTWSNHDKCSYIGLSQNNLRAQYKGIGKTPKDAASVRTAQSIPIACGLYYFEIKVISKGRDGYIGVGLCGHGVNMNKLPGWEKDSYGYHADDGHSFCTSGAGEVYGPTFTTGDVVGCGVNLVDKTVFYTKNGIDLGIAFKDIIPKLYPTVGLQTPGEIVDVNFGQQPFVFDIESKRLELRAQVIQNIENYKSYGSDTNWQSILQKVVSGYLVHHGYSATADCFAKATGQSIKEELSSVRNRQRIQKLILTGRISEAIESTQTLYPGLFDRNRKLFFKLKCRQFIEMVNGCDGEIRPSLHSPTRSLRNSPSTSHRSTPCGSPVRTLSSHSSSGSSCSNCNSQNGFNDYSTEQNTQNGLENSTEDLTSIDDMIVDGYVGNGDYKDTYKQYDEETKIAISSQSFATTSPSTPLSCVTQSSSKSVDTNLSMRQLCGGNLFAIEKLITYGKTLQTIYKDIAKDIGENPDDEILMKEAFSLLAYSNPRDSPVGYLLDASQRESLSAALNSAILEAHNLPGQPALELAVLQSQNCLKTMTKHGLAASSLIKVQDFFCEQ